MRRFRGLNRLWANVCGYYWAPCIVCGQWHGGHEAAAIRSSRLNPTTGRLICWRHGNCCAVDA